MEKKKDLVRKNESYPNSDRANSNKSQVVSITYEEIGLFPRSFSRVLDRFFQQLFSDVDNLIVQEYRFYRFLFLTTLKTLFVLIFLPFAMNLLAKNYIVKPVAEYFWNGQNTEIFLNSYQQTKAFAELNDFEEKLYFESLLKIKKATPASPTEGNPYAMLPLPGPLTSVAEHMVVDGLAKPAKPRIPAAGSQVAGGQADEILHPSLSGSFTAGSAVVSTYGRDVESIIGTPDPKKGSYFFEARDIFSPHLTPRYATLQGGGKVGSVLNKQEDEKMLCLDNGYPSSLAGFPAAHATHKSPVTVGKAKGVAGSDKGNTCIQPIAALPSHFLEPGLAQPAKTETEEEGEGMDMVEQKLQEKTLQLAVHYNNESIEAITNIFSDFLSFLTLLYLLMSLEIQINITKSFLLEVFFGLEDSKKCLLILLITDLLVGYHSPGSWEIFLESLFEHYGLIANQTVVLLLVATLPVLLDVLFKYLIFRHLNRSSPTTVATYQALIE